MSAARRRRPVRRPPGKVVGLGLAVLDELLTVDGFGAREVRRRYAERRVSAGGMVGNALCQVAALGCRARLLTALGDDPEGRRVLAELRRAGVDTRGVLVSGALPTSVAVVLVRRRDGERRFLVPDRRALERRVGGLDVSCIERGDVLLVDGHFPAAALAAVRRARRVGARVVGDFHRPLPAVRRLLPHVDHPVVPREFARAYARGGVRVALRRLRDESGGQPVVTLGARGGIYLDGERIRSFPAPRVRVRDTTGAGDVFHGAFCVGLLRGLPLERTLSLAARAAAGNCRVLGARGRLMTEAELRRFLAS